MRLRLMTPLCALIFALTSILNSQSAQASASDCLSYGYDCTPGYNGSNASATSTRWAWSYYGGDIAQVANGYHNCTLYVAWRLAQSGMDNPGHSWGNATAWKDSIGRGDHNPTVGSIAWYGTGKFGHVAYVEQVSGGNVFVRADNYPANSSAKGYTTAGWVPASSVGMFLHAHDSGVPGSGNFVSYHGDVFRLVGGAPVYVSSWAPFGGAQTVSEMSDIDWSHLRTYPEDGTFVSGAQTGQVYRIAGGAPTYVGSWDPFGGPQPTTAIDQRAIDNAGSGTVWNHLNYRPTDGTFVSGAQTGQVYRIAGGAPTYVGSWDPFGGPQPTTAIDQRAIDNAGSGTVWNHLAQVPPSALPLVEPPTTVITPAEPEPAGSTPASPDPVAPGSALAPVAASAPSSQTTPLPVVLPKGPVSPGAFVPSDVGSPGKSLSRSTLRIGYVQWYSGRRTRSGRVGLNGEYLRLVNVGKKAETLRKFTLKNAHGHVFKLPNVVIGAGGTLTVYTGSGKNSKVRVYLGSKTGAWNDDHDIVQLRNNHEGVVHQVRWLRKGSGHSHFLNA